MYRSRMERCQGLCATKPHKKLTIPTITRCQVIQFAGFLVEMEKLGNRRKREKFFQSGKSNGIFKFLPESSSLVVSLQVVSLPPHLWKKKQNKAPPLTFYPLPQISTLSFSLNVCTHLPSSHLEPHSRVFCLFYFRCLVSDFVPSYIWLLGQGEDHRQLVLGYWQYSLHLNE